MTLRLLAVEDSATQAEALRVLLEEQGYDVTLATSAEAAEARGAANREWCTRPHTPAANATAKGP